MNLNTLTIDSARSAVAEGTATATSLASSFFDAIQKQDGEIGAFLTLSKERALTKAAEIDALVKDGKPLPPLAGVPVAIKDVMVTRGRENDCRFADSRQLCSSLRLDGRGPPGTGGRGGTRKTKLR